MPIEKAYPALEAEYRRIELDKTLTITERNAALAAVRSRWGHCQNDIITALYDQEYMAAVREKLNIIKEFEAVQPISASA